MQGYEMINITINGFWDVTPCSVVKYPNISKKLAVSLRKNIVYMQVSKLTTESLGPEEVGREVSEPTFVTK